MTSYQPVECGYCGGWHTGTCPRVKRITYSGGYVESVEFHDPNDVLRDAQGWPIGPIATASELTRLHAEHAAVSRQIEALTELLKLADLAFEKHELWCGYHRDAPGDSALNDYRRAREAIDGLTLTVSGPSQESRCLRPVNRKEEPMREVTFRDRLIVAEIAGTMLDEGGAVNKTGDALVNAVRCCGEFPECVHVLAFVDALDGEDHGFILNGVRHESDSWLLSYEEIAKLAEAVEPTITWRFASTDLAGTLTPGQTIATGAGLILNATNTGAA